ncbi:MAG: hypothetical protein ABEJ64_01410 [Candidatus Nanohaloarchaea archaeon]
MDTTTPCEYCHRRPAVTTCELCGAKICEEHDREIGCAVCKGGRRME